MSKQLELGEAVVITSLKSAHQSEMACKPMGQEENRETNKPSQNRVNTESHARRTFTSRRNIRKIYET